MSVLKKAIIYISAILLILAVSFIAGYYTNDYYAKKRDSEYTERIDNLEGELKSQDIRNRELTEGLRIATSEITELTEEHQRFVDSLGNFGTGISEDIDRVSGIIERLDGYIKQSE